MRYHLALFIVATLCQLGTQAAADSCGEICTFEFWDNATEQETKEALSTVNVNDTYENGHTLLHLVALWGNVDQVQLLLKRGALVNARDDDGLTPLSNAMYVPDPAVISALLEAGADPNNRRSGGVTPLHSASLEQDTKFAELLLAYGANVEARDTNGATPLSWAAGVEGQDTSEVTRTLLKFGSNPNAKDDDGATPLHWAARAGTPETIRLLLEAGAQIDALQGYETTDGEAPLHTAAWANFKAVTVLLNAGADIGVRDKHGATPLHYASLNGNLEAQEALLQSGADIYARDKDGATPLHYAAFSENPTVSSSLIRYGARVNARDNYNNTPLHDASAKSDPNPEIIKILLAAGADGRLKNLDGATAFDVAEENEKLKGSDAYWSLKTAAKEVPAKEPLQRVASGSGFFVTSGGHIVTNSHVVENCKEVKIHSASQIYESAIITSDFKNDLALLKVNITPVAFLSLSDEFPYALQEVIVAGFPFGDQFSVPLKFTKGIVSSLTGLGNNYSQLQIDAALQPGNSGGPILDDRGNVVAVAVAKLDVKSFLEDFGVIPENVNFGIKASAVRNLMEANRVKSPNPRTEVLSQKALNVLATDATVLLSCWMTPARIKQLAGD